MSWISLIPFFIGSLLQTKVLLINKPLAHQKMILLSVDSNQPKQVASKISDSKGMTRFRVENQKDHTLVVVTSYKGLTYFSDLFSGNQVPKAVLPIVVYPTKEADKRVHVRELNLSFEQRGALLNVDESFVIDNPTHFSIVGKKMEDSDKNEVFRFGLPNSAYALRYGTGFQREAVSFDGYDVVITGPLAPGRNYFSLHYSVDKPRLRLKVPVHFSLPISKVEISTNKAALRPTGLNFKSAGKKLFENQDIYLFQADANHEKSFSLKISGLPLNVPFTWWLPLFSLLILALTLFVPRKLHLSSVVPPSANEKKKLLSDLRLLERMRKREMITSSEYQMKRLRLIQRLSAYYPETKGNT